MMRQLFNKWSQLHIGVKSAIAMVAGINTLSFVETFTATRNTMPSHGITYPMEFYPEGDVASKQWLMMPHGIGNGAMRGIQNHTRLWLLEGYCNAPSPTLSMMINIGNIAGDNGLILALPLYGALGTPGALLGGMAAGGSVAAQELLTDGQYFHLHSCAGTLPYKSLKVFKSPSQRP